MTVLVAGGGITGLVAARELANLGIPAAVLETAPRFGGKIATERVDGYVVERGPDSFVTFRPAAVELVRELGLADELVSTREPRTVHVSHRGRLHPMPDGFGLVLPTRLRPFVTTGLFSVPEKLRMSLDLALPRMADGEGDEPVGRFLRRRVGDAAVDRLAGPLIGGVYGTPIDELSMDAVVPQLRAAEQDHRSLLLAGLAEGRAARRVNAQATGSPAPLGLFVSLAGGMGCLVDALVAELAAAPGVELRPGTAVRELAPRGTGLIARLSDGTEMPAEAAILATPGTVTGALLEPISAAAAAAVRSIRQGSTAVVSLGYPVHRVAQLPDGHGVLVPRSEGMTIGACTWSSRKWPGRAPAGRLLVRAFMPDSPPGSDEAIAAIARAEVGRLLAIDGQPELVRVARWQAAMPRYTVGHLGRVAAAEEALRPWPAITLAGASFHGVGLPDCIAQGRAAAHRVAAVIGATRIRVAV
ncbi:MAG TPA: protoporphyrinogen oxidase [Candidatus Limnocylindrales bacterium]|nr:protoporphyrinogen oxidase [Candidatus Limnocylindrales bacterium]